MFCVEKIDNFNSVKKLLDPSVVTPSCFSSKAPLVNMAHLFFLVKFQGIKWGILVGCKKVAPYYIIV